MGRVWQPWITKCQLIWRAIIERKVLIRGSEHTIAEPTQMITTAIWRIFLCVSSYVSGISRAIRRRNTRRVTWKQLEAVKVFGKNHINSICQALSSIGSFSKALPRLRSIIDNIGVDYYQKLMELIGILQRSNKDITTNWLTNCIVKNNGWHCS